MTLRGIRVTGAAILFASAFVSCGALAQQNGGGLFGGLFDQNNNNARPSPGYPGGQASESEMTVRLTQLENQLRSITGQLEQVQFRNQQMETQLKRMQEDYEFRFQELSGKGGRPAPRPGPATVSAPPAAAPGPASPPLGAAPGGRRSDAFDPSDNPTAPGAPRTLGSVASNSRDYGTAPIMTDEGGNASPRQGSAPMDLNANGGGQLPPPNAGTQVATAPPSQTPKDEFDLGYGYVLRKDYPLAQQAFTDFLRRYPNDKLAGEAQFWLGETMFQSQNYREAATAFVAISKKYEQSPRAPDALLRLGQSLAQLNEKELACATFGEVGRKYPKASAGLKKTVEQEQKRGRC